MLSKLLHTKSSKIGVSEGISEPRPGSSVGRATGFECDDRLPLACSNPAVAAFAFICKIEKEIPSAEHKRQKQKCCGL